MILTRSFALQMPPRKKRLTIELLVVFVAFRAFVGLVHDIAQVRNVSVMLESHGPSADERMPACLAWWDQQTLIHRALKMPPTFWPCLPGAAALTCADDRDLPKRCTKSFSRCYNSCVSEPACPPRR